jgi:hypothetical protein
MSSSSPSSPPSGGGSSALKIILIILVVLALGCGGLCAGCVYMAKKGAEVVQKGADELMRLAQLESAHQTTRQAVLADPRVVERLGEPLNVTEPKRQGEGELKPRGETFQFDVSGPKGTAIVSAVATAGTGSPFKVTTITVKFSDGATIDIAAPADQVDPFDLKIEGGEKK